jgi:hypothetical protein
MYINNVGWGPGSEPHVLKTCLKGITWFTSMACASQSRDQVPAITVCVCSLRWTHRRFNRLIDYRCPTDAADLISLSLFLEIKHFTSVVLILQPLIMKTCSYPFLHETSETKILKDLYDCIVSYGKWTWSFIPWEEQRGSADKLVRWLRYLKVEELKRGTDNYFHSSVITAIAMKPRNMG